MGVQQVAKATDQLVNALLGGDHRETLSARAHRLGTLRGDRKWRTIERGIDRLFFWQPGHCRASFLFELRRDGSPREYRQ